MPKHHHQKAGRVAGTSAKGPTCDPIDRGDGVPEVISKVQALVVGTREAQRMGGWGKTKLFELIAAGELESYLDGSVRRITTASIHARIRRKLQSNAYASGFE